MRQQLLLTLTLGLLILSNCGGDQATKNPSSTAVPAPLGSAGDLNILSHRYLVQDVELYKDYERQAQKKVAVYLTPGVKAIELAEKGELQGDIIILEDLYQAHQLKKLGAIEPYNAGTFDEYVPSYYIDNEGYWAAATKWTMAFVYRKGKAEEIEMQRYAGVLHEKYKGRVVVPHPDSSGLVSFVAGMIATHGEKPTSIYLQMLKKNLVGPPAGSDWQVLQQVLSGEADIAFMNGSAYLRYRNSGNPELYRKTSDLSIDFAVDASGNNYYNISPICILKGTTNRNYAIPMIEFLTSTNNQNVFAESMMEYPVNVFSETTNFINDIYNVAQGKTTMEQTENQLDKARELVRNILGV